MHHPGIECFIFKDITRRKDSIEEIIVTITYSSYLGKLYQFKTIPIQIKDESRRKADLAWVISTHASQLARYVSNMSKRLR